MMTSAKETASGDRLLQPQLPGGDRRPLAKGQCQPTADQTQAAERRDGPEELEARGIQDKRVYASAEHHRAGSE